MYVLFLLFLSKWVSMLMDNQFKIFSMLTETYLVLAPNYLIIFSFGTFKNQLEQFPTFFHPHTLSRFDQLPPDEKKSKKGHRLLLLFRSGTIMASCRRRRRLHSAPTPRPIHVPLLMPYLGDALRLRRSPYMAAVRRTIPGASRRYIRSGKRFGKSLAASPAAVEQLSPYPCLDTEVCTFFL